MSKETKCICGCSDWTRSKQCGVLICDNCGNHKGLVLCYCGWTLDGEMNGYERLVEAGETIEPEDY